MAITIEAASTFHDCAAFQYSDCVLFSEIYGFHEYIASKCYWHSWLQFCVVECQSIKDYRY